MQTLQIHRREWTVNLLTNITHTWVLSQLCVTFLNAFKNVENLKVMSAVFYIDIQSKCSFSSWDLTKCLWKVGRLGHENKSIWLFLPCWCLTSAILCFNYQTATTSENTSIVCSHWITEYFVRHAIIFPPVWGLMLCLWSVSSLDSSKNLCDVCVTQETK